MSKEEVRAAWVELVAASKEYLKLPAEKPKAKLKDASKKEKPKAAAQSSTDSSNNDGKKRAKLAAKPMPITAAAASKLIVATRTHPMFQERYIDLLSSLQEVVSREQWEGDELHVIAMDCEMVQTVDDDMALARISAVEITKDWQAKERMIMDELVMPTTSRDYIIDTRPVITGLNPEDLVERGISKTDARARFLRLLKPHTIMIGHALEHDLLALGINYARVIDTALLFTVEGKMEFTHSLSHLSRAILQEETMRSRREGTHDSVEDAALALRIVRQILCEPALSARTFPIALPKEESGAKRRLYGERGAKAQLLATRIEVAEGSLKATMDAIRGNQAS